MKKIVHVMLAGLVTDGWSYQDNMITKYHKKLGYDVTMITLQWIWGTDGKREIFEKTDYYNSDGVKVIRLPITGQNKLERKFKRFKNFYETLLSENPDIIFVHNISFRDISEVIRYAKLNNEHIKIFVDNHSDFSNSGANWLSKNVLHKIIWRYYAKKINPYVECFYGVLPARVDWLIDMYGLPKEKCKLLVMGADDEKIEEANRNNYREKIREKYWIKKDDFLIMTAGKINNAKRQTVYLMEAVKNLNTKKIKLIVFGSVEEALKEQVNNLADGKIIQYIGWVPSEESYNYFSAADLVVFPGRHSVFWEQIVGMGIPMVCKYWKGTTHVDIGGNVMFLHDDSIEEIERVLGNIIESDGVYLNMLKTAKGKEKETFYYSNIARKSIESVVVQNNK